MPNNENHPIWEVYNLQRNCRMNVCYWTKRVAPLARFNFWMEYLLLATAPSSVVAGLVFWQSVSGKTVWMILTAVTAALAIAKPLLGLGNKIAKLQELVVEYRSTESLLQELGNDIRSADEYSKTMRDTFKALERQYDSTKKKEPVEDSDDRLRQACYDRVDKELPAGSYFIPSKTIKVIAAPAPALAIGGSRGIGQFIGDIAGAPQVSVGGDILKAPAVEDRSPIDPPQPWNQKP